MAKPVLTAEPFLDGYSTKFERAELAEVDGLSLFFIAEPLGGRNNLERELFENFGLSLPDPGSSHASNDGNSRIAWMADGQFLLFFEAGIGMNSQRVSAALGESAHVSDQSDNWVALRLSGAVAEESLERICAVNIAVAAFPAGSVAQTAMEHMRVIAIRELEDGFLLLSPSSSANSFLRALQTSLENIH